MTEEQRDRIMRQNSAIAATCLWVAMLIIILIYGAFWGWSPQ